MRTILAKSFTRDYDLRGIVFCYLEVVDERLKPRLLLSPPLLPIFSDRIER
jgi:hypothetical protein